MTRKLLTNFNAKPYFDDFEVDKNFLRVLFKPGTALQAREITQLQTIINEQIGRLGNHIFKDGSPVLEGSFNVDVNVRYIKLHQTHPVTNGANISSYLSELEGRVLTSVDGSIRFLVRKAAVNTTSEPNTLIGIYLSGGNEISASGGEVLTTEPEDGKTVRSVTTATPGVSDFVQLNETIKGLSSIASVNEGVFYMAGFFHKTLAQTIILEKYSNTPTYRIGLELEESIVNSSDDSSLYDNAQGSSNFSAPGADRFKVSLTLKSQILDSSLGNIISNNASADFYEFVRVRNGQKVDQVKNAQYAYLGEEMARRTHDANGNFVVRNFALDVDEDASDTTKLVVTLDPGKAYVHGREIETISSTTLEMDKGRDTATISDENVSTFTGNFVYVTFPGLLSGETIPDLSANGKLDVINASGTKIGTCRIKQLSYEDPKGYKLSFFDLQLTSGSSKDIFSFKKESGTNNVFLVSSESRVNNITTVSQQERAVLLYNISKSSINSVTGLSYFYNRSDQPTNITYTNPDTFFDISFAGSTDELLLSPNPSGPQYPLSLIRENFIVINQNTGVSYDSLDVTITSAQSATIRVNNVNLTGQTLKVLYKVQSTASNTRSKTQVTGQTVTVNAGGDLTAMKTVGSKVTLDGFSDIIQITSIVGNSSGNVTDRYELDNGQRDTFYDFGSLKLKSGVVVPSADTSFVITFDHFTHTGTGAFTRDSYPNTIEYQDIPIYFSKSSGKSYSLSDVIDFRPTRNLTDAIDGGAIPYGAPADFMEVSYSYFMPRIDKIILTKDKEFRVIKGTSSEAPVTPPDDPNAMSLYIITVPPYTYNDNDLNIIPIHNRRYTMRDIGILDRRIEELQARSNVRLLREKSKNLQIRDASGNDIFKNGILIDDFSGHSIGDINSSDYRCSIDFDTNELRPSFSSESYDIVLDTSNSTNMVQNGPLLLVDHDVVEHQIQPLASKSINLNPHKMAYWFGEIKMNPSSDMWFSQSIKPRVTINDDGENNAWENLSTSVSTDLAKGFGTQWNDWEDLWTGRENYVSSQETDPSSLVESNIVRLQSREAQNSLFDAVDKIGTISAGLPNRIEKDLTSKSLDNSVVPFMRTDEVAFVATNLKPNTLFYAFFDDTALSTEVSSCLEIVPTDSTKVFTDGIYDGDIITGLNGGKARVIKNANDGTGKIYIQTISGSLSANEIISGDKSLTQATINTITTPSQLKSDAAGQLCGVFTIPSSDSSKFRTGQRLFRLIDNSANTLNNTDSVAEVTYTSQGIMDDPENYVVSTRLPLTKRSNICDALSVSKDVFSRELNAINRCLDWKDPLSQTFIVDSASNRNGIFLKSLDLFFKTKDDTLPVMVEIRPTVNGYPSTSTVIPFSEVILNPSQVVVSNGPDPETSSNKNTRFSFDAPVYLSPGEYAIVIKTNSSNYELWEGVIGESRLETTGIQNNQLEKITKQPLVGHLYSSHNSGTWEQLNNESLMFRLNKCQFKTSATSSATLNVSLPAQSKSIDLFKFNVSMLKNFTSSKNPTFNYTIGSDSAINFHENRNIELPSSKSIGGATTFKITSTIPTSTSTDVCPVIDMERISLITVKSIVDSVEYDVSDLTIENAGAGYLATDVFKITDVTDSTKTATFNPTVDGSGSITGFSLISSSKNMTNGVTTSLSTSTGSSASIVVDSETSPSGSVADAVYISKRVNLKSPYESKDIRVYLDLFKPSGSNVHVYYKVANTNDSTIFDDRNWYLMSQVTPEYIVSEYSNDYREYVFGTNGGVELVTDGTLDNFNVYAIKVVFSSSNTSRPPKARNLRAIALQEFASV